MKILAVDYDGVIVDSVMDSLFVSHNAYLNLFGESQKRVFGGKPFTFQNWPIIQEKYQKEIRYYRSLRPYIRGATDYGLIQKLMEEGRSIRNQQEFDQYRNTVQFDFQNFHDSFYQAREAIQKDDFEGWLTLEPPYQGVIQGIRQFIKEGVKAMIATSNRREYIARTFDPQYYNIPVSDDDILDFRFGEDKSSQMHHIREKYHVDYHDIYFVDDQLAHLEQTRHLGIHIFLAGWSYATGQQKEDAREKNIIVIEKDEEFYPRIKETMIRNQ